MSGTFPSSPALEEIELIGVSPTFVSFSHSLKRQARSRGAQRWYIKGKLPPMYRSEAMPIYAFLVKQRGQYESFNIVLPVLSSARGIGTGTPKVNGASQTGRSIVTDGWTVSQTGILLAGDILTFSGHDKVYMITADVNSDGSGNATLSIEPALEESPADDAVITVNDVVFTVANTDDAAKLTLKAIMFGTEISFVEDPG